MQYRPIVGSPAMQAGATGAALVLRPPPGFAPVTGQTMSALYAVWDVPSGQWRDPQNPANRVQVPCPDAGDPLATVEVTVVVLYPTGPRPATYIAQMRDTGGGQFDFTVDSVAASTRLDGPDLAALLAALAGQVYRGAWSNTTQYRTGNSVTYNGSTFRALRDNLNKQPSGANPPVDTLDWAVQAMRGANGAGDMLKSTYDTNGNGVVDNAEALGGQPPAYYAPTNHDHSRLLMFGQSGGTVGKFVRKTSSPNVWANASNTDSSDALAMIAYQVDSTTLVTQGYVGGLSGLTPGQPVYLSTAGGYTQVAPTPGGGVSVVPLGQALSATEMVLEQGTINSGGGGSGRTTVTDAPASLTNNWSSSWLTLPGPGHFEVNGMYYFRQTAGSNTSAITPTLYVNTSASQAGSNWVQGAVNPNYTEVFVRGYVYWDGSNYFGQLAFYQHGPGSSSPYAPLLFGGYVAFSYTGIASAPQLKFSTTATAVNTIQVNGYLSATKAN